MKLNLLHEDVVVFSKAARLRRANRLVLMVSGTIFLVLAAAAAVQYFYYSYRSSSEKSKLKQFEAVYASRADEVVRYIRLKEMLFQSQNVISGRRRYQELLTGAYSTFPAGVEVAAAEFKGINDLTFSGRALGVSEYEAFLKKFKLESQSGVFLFENVTQDSLGRQEDGVYQFNLSLKAK